MISSFVPMVRILPGRVRHMASGALVRMRVVTDATSPTNFVHNIVASDIKTGKHSAVVTRFPPEPNGYLHIGHAKAICLNFGMADEFDGIAYMRLDDTNPLKESTEYVDSILQDVTWLGGRWGDRLTHASDYFGQLYTYAEELIEDGKAYVDSAPVETVREYRGNWNTPGLATPDRDRPREESLHLFRRMRAGDFEEGSYSLRAKIDLLSSNMNMRDPVMYRIRHATHQQTSDEWCIYPMYDFTHPICDALEGVTHSLCTLEFQANRPLYDWFLTSLRQPPVVPLPRQIEVSRLNLHYTVLSKRRLVRLVDEGHVEGWDDPRMPTIAGMRRRGYPPSALQLFCDRTGISKEDKNIDMSVLEDCVRECLESEAPRAMAVLRPLKVTVTNWPAEHRETLLAPVHPKDHTRGKRELTMTRELYVDAEDFMLEPTKKFFRLGPGREVRLRNSYAIKCDEVLFGPDGTTPIELKCSYDPETRQGKGRKVKGIVHWVSADPDISVPISVRLWDRLFVCPVPGASKQDENGASDALDYMSDINPTSREEVLGFGEKSLKNTQAGQQYQFERLGYFVADLKDSAPDNLVFNRVVTLRDTWGKLTAAEATHTAKAPKRPTD